jgi:preprotein translocase subunit SecG
MTTLHWIVLIVHVLIAVGIVGLVLLQRGKGAEAGAAFGAGASSTIFGARGSANFLSRSTAVLAAMFFATSLGLAYLGAQRKPAASVLDEVTPAAEVRLQEGVPAGLGDAAPAAVPAPAAPAGSPAPAPEGSPAGSE